MDELIKNYKFILQFEVISCVPCLLFVIICDCSGFAMICVIVVRHHYEYGVFLVYFLVAIRLTYNFFLALSLPARTSNTSLRPDPT